MVRNIQYNHCTGFKDYFMIVVMIQVGLVNIALFPVHCHIQLHGVGVE